MSEGKLHRKYNSEKHDNFVNSNANMFERRGSNIVHVSNYKEYISQGKLKNAESKYCLNCIDNSGGFCKRYNKWATNAREYCKKKKEQESKRKKLYKMLKSMCLIQLIRILIGLNEKGDEYGWNIYAEIENKMDAYTTMIYLNAIKKANEDPIKEFSKILTYMVHIKSDDITFIMTQDGKVTGISGTNKTLVSTNDYYSVEWLMENEVNADYSEQVAGFIADFFTEK